MDEDFFKGSLNSELDDSAPLLDTSNEIELRSQDWPVYPDSNSEALSDDSFCLHRNNTGFKLMHPFGEHKQRMLVEVFIMVNLAQLMYTCMLAFSKQALVATNSLESINTVTLCLFRSIVLLSIHGLRLTFTSEKSVKKGPKEETAST